MTWAAVGCLGTFAKFCARLFSGWICRTDTTTFDGAGFVWRAAELLQVFKKEGRRQHAFYFVCDMGTLIAAAWLCILEL